MFALITMGTFILIAVLGFFHVISIQATAWCFVAWFVALVLYSMVRIEPRAEPDLENAFPLGKSHLVTSKSDEALIPPRGLGGYVPDAKYIPNLIAKAAFDDWNAITGKISDPPYGGPSNPAFLALVEAIDARLSHEDARPAEKSDKSYDEPQATYPEMTMEQSS